MISRVIDIETEGCSLDRFRGFMTVVANGSEKGRVPLDDIGALLCHARRITYTNSLFVELAARNVTAVICDRNHLPVAWLWPLQGNHVQALRIRSQIDAPKPLTKRLWQTTVRAKIAHQKATLERLGRSVTGFDDLIRKVRSGDPSNVEAQAARRYWRLLMGKSFRRERYGSPPNGLLNYGYTVLRAGTARAVVAAGLHPTVAIHHSNRGNAMALVDDLMEPFRPTVDLIVARLVHLGDSKVNSETKRALGNVLNVDMMVERGTSPLQTCLERAAQSLAASYEQKEARVNFPLPPMSLAVQR